MLSDADIRLIETGVYTCMVEEPVRDAVGRLINECERLDTRLAELEAAMDRGGIDIRPCGGCGLPTAWRPIACLCPLCESCVVKEDSNA